MQAGTPLSIETPPKSSGNTDQGLMKKLKEFDGLAMSIGNGHAESAERGGENRLSQRFVDLFSFCMNIFNDILSEFLDISLSYVGGGGEGKICHLKLFSKLNLLSLLLSRMVVHELVIVMESYG